MKGHHVANNLLRGAAMRAAFPMSKSRLYELIQIGEFCPPVKLGPRASAWPAEEVTAMILARTAGLGGEQIARLVSDLVEARPHRDAAARRDDAIARALGGRA